MVPWRTVPAALPGKAYPMSATRQPVDPFGVPTGLQIAGGYDSDATRSKLIPRLSSRLPMLALAWPVLFPGSAMRIYTEGVLQGIRVLFRYASCRKEPRMSAHATPQL